MVDPEYVQVWDNPMVHSGSSNKRKLSEVFHFIKNLPILPYRFKNYFGWLINGES